MRVQRRQRETYEQSRDDDGREGVAPNDLCGRHRVKLSRLPGPASSLPRCNDVTNDCGRLGDAGSGRQLPSLGRIPILLLHRCAQRAKLDLIGHSQRGKAMEDVVIVSGVRTAIGKFQGGFSNTPASDLGAAVIREAVERAGLQPEQVDQVILGCVGQVAEDGYIARHASVKAGMPIETPALTVNRICGSGLEAINTAARWLADRRRRGRRRRRRREHDDDAVLRAQGALRLPPRPRARSRTASCTSLSDPFEQACTWASPPRTSPRSTRSRARRRTSSRCARRSAPRAAIDAGNFKDEIVPRRGEAGQRDGDLRHRRAPARDLDGGARQAARRRSRTAAWSPPATPRGINDGAAAVVVMTAAKARELGLKPRLRLVARAEAGVEPSIMGAARSRRSRRRSRRPA